MKLASAAGFSLPEILVASVIVLVLVGGALVFTSQAQAIFDAQPEAADVQQRVRVAVDSLQRDLTMAGAGTYAGPASGPLTYFVAPIMPYRAFGASADPVAGVYYRDDAFSYLYVPQLPAQTRLLAPLPSGAADLEIEALPNCPLPTSSRLCGFGVGDRVLVFDDGGTWEVFTVDQVAGGLVQVRHRGQPPAAAFARGSAVTRIELGTYYLGTDRATGASRLMSFDGWLTDSPVVDEVVELRFRYFGVGEPPSLVEDLDRQTGPWTTYGPAPPRAGVSRGAWPPGESCTFLLDADGQPVSRLATLGAGGSAMVELPAAILTDGPWCPDATTANRFDADLLRIRQVRVSLRVQSALASLRGPAGVLFARGGTARAGARYVPDLSVEFDVMPRNMSLAW